MHNYYQIPARDLGQGAKIDLRLMPDSEAVFRYLATEMLAVIREAEAAGREVGLILPVGPVGQYAHFVRLVQEQGQSLRHVWFFNMDEYLQDPETWIDSEHRLSFRAFMDRALYSQLPSELLMPESQRLFPDPRCPERLGDCLERLGGAELCVGGIGINGHLAFNEAEPEATVEDFSGRRTRVLEIAPETRTANAIGDLGGALEEMPRWAVTIGMREILASRRILLGVFRPWHRAVLRRAAYGVCTAAFPVSLLQGHPNACICVNDVAAELPY